MLYGITMFVHILVCVFLIIVVLLQSGKAADLAGAFGGMGSQTAFGPRGSATLLSKATTISAVLFMITSFSLSVLATKNAGLATTVLEEKSAPVKSQPLPSIPGAPAPGAANPPMTMTPKGGKPVELPTPAPADAPIPQVPVQQPPKK